MELTGRVQAEFDTTEPENRPVEVYVDAIGMGYGVLDALNNIGRMSAVGINVAESPSQKETYMNLRSELWFKFKNFLESKMCKLPRHELMIADLVSVKYKFTASGRIQVESKEQIKKRIGRSPDYADAMVLLMAGDAVASRAGSYMRDWKQPLTRDIKGVV
jgi:phage FluMu gp28-like protein